jgi:hypothetical protein
MNQNPRPARRTWERVALAADMIPGVVTVLAGLAVVIAGCFPQVLAAI